MFIGLDAKKLVGVVNIKTKKNRKQAELNNHKNNSTNT
jgi:hypothetical protein